MTEFLKTRSVLAVRDLESSTRFYCDVLGFALDPIEAPGWRFVSRGAASLMLGECPDEMPARATGNHSWFLHVMVTGIDELHRDLKRQGVRIPVEIGDRSHGHREFVLETPDGHRILFGEPI